jgi:subtilisin family serine protease
MNEKMKEDIGIYFWRNGERIPIEREAEYITVIARDEDELNRVRSLPGVNEAKQVQNQVFKLLVDEDKRDYVMDSIRSDEIEGVCHHAYRPVNATNTRYYLTDQIVVKFEPDTSGETIEKLLAEAGVRLLKEYSGSNNTFLLQVTRDAGKNPIKVANILAGMDEVAYAEPNLVNRFSSSYIPADTHFDEQWHLQSWNAPELVADADVSATGAWDITRGRRDIVIAVIDDGFDLSHPDFMGTGKVVHPKDYVDGDANPFPESSEGDYHGTPCAGVALAEENGEGVVGVAPGCGFMPVRFPLTADDSFLWEIFDYVGRYADVISCSWGPPPVYAPLPQLLSDKFHDLAVNGGPRKKGCVILFAAGNYNAPLNDPDNAGFQWRHSRYGLQDTNGPILNGNAAHPDVIAVAASTSMNRKAVYSNWGKEVALSTPSNNFHPLDRQARVPGRGIWTTDNEQHGGGFTSGSRYTGSFGGTSSATPLAAGVAALIVSANPTLTADEVKQIMQSTADKIEDDLADPVLGHNKGTYDGDGHSEWFGYGKVNAAQAVERSRELLEDTTGISELKLDTGANGQLANSQDEHLFKVNVGANLGVTLKGPDGEDFDLYVKYGSPPTTEDYDAVGYSPSANEKVVLPSAQPGDYYIMVRSYRGSGDFDLKVETED